MISLTLALVRGDITKTMNFTVTGWRYESFAEGSNK